MILLDFYHPIFLDHFEEEMTSKNDLDFIKSIGRYCHAEHVAHSVREWIYLLLNLKSVGQLNKCLDS